MLRFGFNIAAVALNRTGEALPPPPPRSIDTIVIEGDSITSNQPSTYGSVFYSYRFQDATSGKSVIVRAQGSRVIGSLANIDDNGNSLIGNVAEDMAYAPDLVTVMIGANDLSGGVDTATYRARLIDYYNAIKTARPECLVAWSAPIPFNPDNQHPAYATFAARRAELMVNARDPQVWGQWADFYLPMGDHPDWRESPSLSPSLWGDSVHPTGYDPTPAQAGGQNRLYDQYKAAIDTLIDPARVNATGPYGSVWPGNETDLAAGTTITRRFVLSGLAHTGASGDVTVSGDGNPGVRVNSTGAFSQSAGMTRLYNGDVVDLQVTISSSFETARTITLTIAGDSRDISFTSAADVMPVAYIHGGRDETFQSPSTTLSTIKSFATGKPLVQLWANGAAASVLVGGLPCTRRLRSFRAATRGFEIWEGPEVAAGDHAIDVTYSTGVSHRFIAWGTIQNGAFVSAQGQSDAAPPTYQPAPFLTPDWGSTPANGLALCYLGCENTDTVSANGAMTLIDHGTTTYQSSNFGLAVGLQTTDGPGSFNAAFGRRLTGYALYAAS